MGAKRKRPSRKEVPNKRTQATSVIDTDNAVHVDHPVLKHYFSKVSTLREHLVADLQERRQRETIVAKISNVQATPVARILDTVIVGHHTNVERNALRERRAKDVISFTQQLPSSTIGSDQDIDQNAQLEIVDFVIWLLFRRAQAPSKPQHLLAQGFDRLSAKGERGLDLSAVPGIPGIICRYSNPHTELVVSSAWCSLLSMLGKGGDIIMVDLLLESCLFLLADKNTRSLRQFSGTPLSNLQPVVNQSTTSDIPSKPEKALLSKSSSLSRLPSAIKFVRNRMFFAQPAISASNNIKFGLHSIHVLNRYADAKSSHETVHVMKHIFPRQFCLHNVFTSPVDSRESALPFKDYTLREAEIKRLSLGADGAVDTAKQLQVPKRLSGQVIDLVAKMRKLHGSCAYTELLKHYCKPSSGIMSFVAEGNMPTTITELATPASNVSAFCQAVVIRVIPKAFLGEDEAGAFNRRLVLKHIDTFLRARKFESFTLQSFMDGFKIGALSWLCLSHQTGHHMSQSDFAKRKELLAEFIYWLFDSFLIPLVRSNFHVTESNVHRNRLFYFQHDVWQKLCEPALEDFKTNLFQELNSKDTKQRLASRTFGYSSVRLLPKVNTFRPITNLRRRPYIWVNGKKMLGRSINSALNPAFRALNHEKTTHVDDLGCSLFSVSDIYPKLKEYQSRLQDSNQGGQQLYFAKVDVQACFDTIPQNAVLRVVKALLDTGEYLVQNEARVKAPEAVTLRKGEQGLRSVVKFSSNARPSDHVMATRHDDTTSLGNGVLVAPLGQQSYRRPQIEEMITEHVQFNLIKIGRKYYRQKNGIPQGSVLSSLLCNFFYGKLENEELHFLQGKDETCLLRLIDDFLLITTEQHLAERFLHLMHQGLPEYGVSIKPSKSLVSFNCEINGMIVPRTDGKTFPYCGLDIDIVNLDLRRSAQVKPGTTTSDSLTIEYSNVPGRTFQRKALNALKIQMHGMYFDTSFNSLDTALANLYRLFQDAAQRIEHYIRSMPKHTGPSFRSVKGTIENLIELAYTMIIRRRRQGTQGEKGSGEYECAIRKEQAICIACQAFRDVFLPRQTKHAASLDWLRRRIATTKLAVVERKALLRVVPTIGK